MTLREPRLWEYHNELAGGTGNAFRQFGNEGLDLGQRFHELRAFHDRHIAASGLPLYVDYWVGEQQMRGARLSSRRRVESLADTNVRGHYDGWFVYPMRSEEHTSELQSLMRISYAVSCLKKKKNTNNK